jgi:hypothetical protein
MNLNVLQRRLLRDVLEVGNALPLVITGGCAVQAHGLVDRESHDIDVATQSLVPMDKLADLLVTGLTERGWEVRVLGISTLFANFMVTDPRLGEECQVDILRESFSRPPDSTPYGPVLAFDDVIGTKVRALTFSLEGLANRLNGCLWFDDEEFFAYGLTEEDLAELRRWALGWAEDIRRRMFWP